MRRLVALLDKSNGNIFISYDTDTGLKYAREAKRVATEAGYTAWMWDSDHIPGAFTADEIAKNIEGCDWFFYLCTTHDKYLKKWNGQPWERNLAFGLDKPPKVFTLDPSFVPLIFRGQNYNKVSADTFVSQCRQVVEQLATEPKLGKMPQYRGEADRLDSAR